MFTIQVGGKATSLCRTASGSAPNLTPAATGLVGCRLSGCERSKWSLLEQRAKQSAEIKSTTLKAPILCFGIGEMSTWNDYDRWAALCSGLSCPICCRNVPLDLVATLEPSWGGSPRLWIRLSCVAHSCRAVARAAGGDRKI